MIEDETPTHREDDSVAARLEGLIEGLESGCNALRWIKSRVAATSKQKQDVEEWHEQLLTDIRSSRQSLEAARGEAQQGPAVEDGYTNGVHSCWGQVTSSAECEQDPQGRWHFIDCAVLDSLLAQSAVPPPTPAPRRMMGTEGAKRGVAHDWSEYCAKHGCQPLPEPVESEE